MDVTVEQFGLSPRETDLLVAAIAGVPRQVVCDQLGTTHNTAKSIAKSALRKLPHSSLDEVAREILRHALEGSHVTASSGTFPAATPPQSRPATGGRTSVASDMPSPAPRLAAAGGTGTGLGSRAWRVARIPTS